jgi:hypothetical protein
MKITFPNDRTLVYSHKKAALSWFFVFMAAVLAAVALLAFKGLAPVLGTGLAAGAGGVLLSEAAMFSLWLAGHCYHELHIRIDMAKGYLYVLRRKESFGGLQVGCPLDVLNEIRIEQATGVSGQAVGYRVVLVRGQSWNVELTPDFAPGNYRAAVQIFKWLHKNGKHVSFQAPSLLASADRDVQEAAAVTTPAQLLGVIDPQQAAPV